LSKTFFAISNHGTMLGGGEHAFLDFLSSLPSNWTPVASVPQKSELESKLKKERIKTVVIPLPAVRPWLIHEIIKSIKVYLNNCKKFKSTLIYANGSRAAFYGGLAGRILRTPIVWHCRITERDPILDSFLTRFCTRIIVNSKSTATRFQNKALSKVRIIYNGIDLKRYQKRSLQTPVEINKEWQILLQVARVSRSKRHDMALTAFEGVAHLDPRVHLICIGDKDRSDPQWWESLHKRAIRSRFSDRIHWMGHADDVRPWYQAARMLLFPSENESFGRVLVEAMACGLPVVAARSGGVPEIVRDGMDGLLVTPGKEKEFSAAVNRILSDGALRRRLGQSARERAERFGLDTHVKNMLAVFDDLT
jgi:glycosyltransferase involved in cell wall biosynthesis